MCDCTHADASSASTNTRARDLSASSGNHQQANASSNSGFDTKLNSPETTDSSQQKHAKQNQASQSQAQHSQTKQNQATENESVTTANLRTDADPQTVAGLSPNMDTSADSIQFLHLQVEETGLFVHGNTLSGTSFQPGEEVSIVLFNGTAVITTDQQKRALINASQELQLRQDELKEDFSLGIVQLLKTLCQSVLDDISPPTEPLSKGYFEKRLKNTSALPTSPSSSVT